MILDNRRRVSLPKSLCDIIDWHEGDEIQPKLVNLELVKKILSGEINLDSGKTPIIIFNTEKKDEPKRKARTVFD